jgi:hypothetical protein
MNGSLSRASQQINLVITKVPFAFMIPTQSLRLLCAAQSACAQFAASCSVIYRIIKVEVIMAGFKSPLILEKIQQDKRQWLSLLGKCGALAALTQASPLAAAVVANRLSEAQAAPPKKFILLYHPGGAPRNYLNSIAVNPFVPFGDTVAALTMNILIPGNHGLTFQAAGANAWKPEELNSSTIDQQIADTIGHLTPLRSMELGVLSGSYDGLVRSKALAKPRIDSPELAVQRYWGQFSAGSVNAPSAYDRRKAMLAAQQQGLDKILGQISADERFKLEEHIAAIEHYHQRLEANTQWGSNTGPCGNVVYTAGNSPLNLYRAQGDLAVTALACGLTNVASIQFNNTQEDWLPNDGTAEAVPVRGDHAQVLNSGGQLSYLPAVNEYMNKGVAHIINKLIQAGIFQNTVVLCVTEMGDSTNNSPDAGPITVATGIAGFKGGRRNLQDSHYKIFPDIIRLLGLEWAINKTIYNYSGGGIVV